MKPFSWRVLPRRFLVQTALGVFFGFFFNTLLGQGSKTLVTYLEIALIFSYVIFVTNLLNRYLVLPRLLRATGSQEKEIPWIEVGSFAASSLVGSILAGIIVNGTIARGGLGTPRGIFIFVSFTIFFCALFLGVIYAYRFQRRYTQRIRAEAETKAREEEELRIAGEIQRALLPGRPRATRSFAAAGASIACRTIGGDFFDYFDLPDGRLGFALGDVAGKGPPAALLAAMVQGIFTSHVDDGHGPAGTIERVNRVLAQRIVEGRFATIFYAVLSPEGRLVSCNAGNNPPLLLRRDGSVRRLEKGGLPIGPFADVTFEEEETDLKPGDTIVLYSDGVSDATDPNDETFGDDRLLACLGSACAMPPEGVIEHVLGQVRAFAADRPQFDDITLLVVRYEGA